MQSVGLKGAGAIQPPVSPDISIRRLEVNDLPAVIRIERRSFPAPWSSAMFLSEMSRAHSMCFAADEHGEVIGFMITTRIGDAWHLNNVAVDPGRRGRGVGGWLVERLLERIGHDAPVTLEVRPSNRAAIALYLRFGFERIGSRKAYYPDNREDALIMWRNPPDDVPRS